MFSIFGKKEKKSQKVIVNPELGELKFDAIEWYPATRVKVACFLTEDNVATIEIRAKRVSYDQKA